MYIYVYVYTYIYSSQPVHCILGFCFQGIKCVWPMPRPQPLALPLLPGCPKTHVLNDRSNLELIPYEFHFYFFKATSHLKASKKVGLNPESVYRPKMEVHELCPLSSQPSAPQSPHTGPTLCPGTLYTPQDLCPGYSTLSCAPHTHYSPLPPTQRIHLSSQGRGSNHVWGCVFYSLLIIVLLLILLWWWSCFCYGFDSCKLEIKDKNK